ncbi:hypothetical protein PV433_29985 [Paenibacillus sp. GYB004]|uniref:hypothetical protein n=1 Tax=Paenibacillus sp. GYB004 TaxID=2994393 RepID=UPI002F967FF9
MKNSRYKPLKAVAITSLLACMISPTVIASDYTEGRSYTWSPYYNTSSANYNYLVGSNTFYFDQAGIDEHEDAWYFTSEIQNMNDDGLGYYSQTTNIPNPSFDYDDDDNDGYEEELEVTETTIGTDMVANTNYYHYGYWENKTSSSIPGGSLHFIAQRSAWNPFNGEFETVTYDFLEQVEYGAVPASLMSINNSSSTVTNSNVAEKKRVTASKITNKSELEDTKLKQQKFVKDVKRNNKIITKSLEATVTFNAPISVEKVENILEKSNSNLRDYEIKWVNGNGQWVTGHAKKLEPKVREIIEKGLLDSGKEQDLRYEGITSARIELSLDEYEKLTTNEHILFVDISESIIKAEQGADTDVQVPDLAWKINDLK